ncbi:MAG TPA: hypothetical protein VGL35_10540, partial [Rhizomicrobium sp.]
RPAGGCHDSFFGKVIAANATVANILHVNGGALHFENAHTFNALQPDVQGSAMYGFASAQHDYILSPQLDDARFASLFLAPDGAQAGHGQRVVEAWADCGVLMNIGVPAAVTLNMVGSGASNSTTITVSSTGGIAQGMAVAGISIPVGDTVDQVINGTQFTITPLPLKGAISNGNITINGGFRAVEISDGDSGATVTATSDEPKCSIADSAVIQQDGAAAASTAVFGNGHASYSVMPVVSPQIAATAPQGRLTLASGTPVMTADAVNQATVYYAPYIGSHIPIYNGVQKLLYQFTTGTNDAVGLTLQLDSNMSDAGYQASGGLFDFYAGLNAGVVTLCTGPAWSTTTSRGSAAVLQLIDGLWTNKQAITCRYGNSSSSTMSCAANACTYLGTMYATADGQTGMQFGPNTANGGPSGGNTLGIWNAYNRVPTTSYAGDTNTFIAPSSTSWEEYHHPLSGGGDYNRVTFVDGLQQSSVEGNMIGHVVDLGTSSPQMGVCFNSATCTPTQPSITFSTTKLSIPYDISSPPQQAGKNYAQAMEQATNTSGADFGPESLRLKVEY